MVLLFSTMVECLGNNMASGIEVILTKLGSSTLQMIGSDYLSYPEHRQNYFLLLKNIVQYCFQCMCGKYKEYSDLYDNSRPVQGGSEFDTMGSEASRAEYGRNWADHADQFSHEPVCE